MRKQRVGLASWLVLLFLAVGCQLPIGPAGAAVRVASVGGEAAMAQGLVVEAAGLADAGQCRVMVGINRPERDLEAAVHVEAESVIRFRDSNSWRSNAVVISMAAGETRRLDFDCQLAAENVGLSGEYVVRAVVIEGSSGEVYQAAEARLNVLVGENNVASFASPEEWNRQANEGFVAGGGNLHYRFELEAAERPTRGKLYLKIVGNAVNFSPEVAARVWGGITFVEGPAKSSQVKILSGRHIQVHFGGIAQSGSRIVVLPFEMEAGSLLGTYKLAVAENEGAAAWKEDGPRMIEVAEAEGQHWLREVALPAGVGSPVAAGADDLASFFPNRPVGVAVAPSPTAAPTSAAGAGIVQAAYGWERRLTRYYGSCRDVYNQFIEGKVALNWEAFRPALIERNPDLATTNCMLDPFKVYWLPGEAVQVAEALQ